MSFKRLHLQEDLLRHAMLAFNWLINTRLEGSRYMHISDLKYDLSRRTHGGGES